MARILCIETATTNCSVALSVNGSVIAFQEDNPTNIAGKKFSHAETLQNYIAQVLEKGAISKNDLDAIAISKGPGSYTGLRIGVSTAKGLCYALDIPLIAINTLEVLASQVSETIVIPMLDARRMEVYSAVFSSEILELRETQAQILDASSFSSYLDKEKVTFIGDGVTKFKEITTHPNAFFIENALPSARQMAPIAEIKFTANNLEDVAYFEPYYLKDFIAH